MKQKTITDIYGRQYKVSCLGCDLRKGRIQSTGVVLSTKYFEVEQDTEIPIPGFMILASKRHLISIGDFTRAEQKEFVDILVKVRRAMRRALGVKVVYFFQNEDTDSHFHIWIFPRYKWMNKFGKKIQSVRPIMEYARQKLKTKKNLKTVEASRNKLKIFLNK